MLKVEMPNTDAVTILKNETELAEFLAKHNNPETVYDAKWNTYRIPAFAEGRKQYSDQKQKQVDAYGS